jgi:hypothetical protein
MEAFKKFEQTKLKVAAKAEFQHEINRITAEFEEKILYLEVQNLKNLEQEKKRLSERERVQTL